MKLQLFLIVVFACAIMADFGSKNKLSRKLVITKNGPVAGILKDSRNPKVEYISFLGLRYANPTPRFEPAKRLDKNWNIPIVADSPGNVCMQPGGIGKDDCLFLNVHVPDSALNDDGTPAKQLPVIFYVHGGGYTFGEGHTYGAEYLLENEDVILVTTNYRLGALGFITMETDTSFTANNGLRDIIVALQWVQQNIAAFGGDPKKVALFGESAGSSAVHYLLMSPLAKGLFHAAAMLSGTHCFWSYAPNPRNETQRLAETLACSSTGNAAEIRKCLENVTGDKLMQAQSEIMGDWPQGVAVTKFLPTAEEPQENAFFSSTPSSFFSVNGEKSEYPNKVPVILGATRDEGSSLFAAYILAVDGALSKLNAEWNTVAPKAFFYERFVPKDKFAEVSERLREFYFGQQPITQDNLDPLIRLYTDALILLPVFQAAKDMAISGMSVWPYIFTHYGKNGGKDKVVKRIPGKIGHADDLQYVFTHPTYGPSLETPEDIKFSKEVVKFWNHFAHTGTPGKLWEDRNSPWSPISVENDSKMEFRVLEIHSQPKIVSYDFQNRFSFWLSVFEDAHEGAKNIMRAVN